MNKNYLRTFYYIYLFMTKYIRHCIFYLIQPQFLLGSDVYKFGITYDFGCDFDCRIKLYQDSITDIFTNNDNIITNTTCFDFKELKTNSKKEKEKIIYLAILVLEDFKYDIRRVFYDNQFKPYKCRDGFFSGDCNKMKDLILEKYNIHRKRCIDYDFKPDIGLFYLVQPKIFLGTNIYKIGITLDGGGYKLHDAYKDIFTNKDNIMLNIDVNCDCISRIQSYKQGTITYLVIGIENVKIFERAIITEFNSHFTLHKGKEFFIGDCNRMKDLIKNKYNEFINNKYKFMRKYCFFKDHQIYVDFDYNNQWSTIYNRYKFKQNISFILGNLHFYNIQQYSEQLLC